MSVNLEAEFQAALKAAVQALLQLASYSDASSRIMTLAQRLGLSASSGPGPAKGPPGRSPLYLSVDQVAVRANVSKATVYRALRRGWLSGRKISEGRVWRVHIDKVSEWLAVGNQRPARKAVTR